MKQSKAKQAEAAHARAANFVTQCWMALLIDFPLHWKQNPKFRVGAVASNIWTIFYAFCHMLAYLCQFYVS